MNLSEIKIVNVYRINTQDIDGRCAFLPSMLYEYYTVKSAYKELIGTMKICYL